MFNYSVVVELNSESNFLVATDQIALDRTGSETPVVNFAAEFLSDTSEVFTNG